jgi:hypothetical protein
MVGLIRDVPGDALGFTVHVTNAGRIASAMAACKRICP